MEKPIKKLRLNKETIEKLNNNEMHFVQGGQELAGDNTVIVKDSAVCSGVCQSSFCTSTFCGSFFACGTYICAGPGDGCGGN